MQSRSSLCVRENINSHIDCMENFRCTSQHTHTYTYMCNFPDALHSHTRPLIYLIIISKIYVCTFYAQRTRDAYVFRKRGHMENWKIIEPTSAISLQTPHIHKEDLLQMIYTYERGVKFYSEFYPTDATLFNFKFFELAFFVGIINAKKKN